jgi:EAL domain-containing protein (putative c-di-GMP-specific phosphodiesterase class I)
VVAFDRALSHASASRAAAAAAEGERLRALMQTIDERLVRCDYQPIVDVADWSLHGYEALCRPTDPQFAGPRALFQMAEAVGRVVPLGRTVREACTASIDALPEPARLFVNLHPHELHDRELLDGETRLRRYARRIVFELTESAEIQDYGRTRDALARLRSLGFRVALDDFGAGYAGLNLLAMLEPDYVKLDVAMVRSVRTNPRSARILRHLLDFARGENMIVIADGIETVEELNAVRELGVRYMQGYYFARPEPGFVAPAGRPPG